MGEAAVFIAKIAFRGGIIAMSIVAFVALLMFAVSFFFVVLDVSVISDLFALIQMWLPFDLSSVFAWIAAASAFYIIYRLSVVSVNYLDKFIK